MATNKIQKGLRLNIAVNEKAMVLAAKEKRPFNNLIEYVVQKYIDNYENENGPIEICYEE